MWWLQEGRYWTGMQRRRCSCRRRPCASAMGPPRCPCGRSSCPDTSASRQTPCQDSPLLSCQNLTGKWLHCTVLQERAPPCGPLINRYFRRGFEECERAAQEQLEAITPCTDISAHLAELSHLYEASCPVLSNIYMLLAPLSPESLPGMIKDPIDSLSSLTDIHVPCLFAQQCQQLHPKHLLMLFHSLTDSHIHSLNVKRPVWVQGVPLTS